MVAYSRAIACVLNIEPPKGNSYYTVCLFILDMNSTAFRFARFMGENSIVTTKEFDAITESLSRKCGVYFLYCRGSLVYIGKSRVLGDRIKSSIIDKSSNGMVDRYSFVETATESDANVLESMLIAEAKPKLNKNGKTEDPLTRPIDYVFFWC